MSITAPAEFKKIINTSCLKQLKRYLATTSVEDVLFPTKSDFPSRHIGPRKTDVVSMLDTLGYKVSKVI